MQAVCQRDTILWFFPNGAPTAPEKETTGLYSVTKQLAASSFAWLLKFKHHNVTN
jgi:hypothetical protein